MKPTNSSSWSLGVQPRVTDQVVGGGTGPGFMCWEASPVRRRSNRFRLRVEVVDAARCERFPETQRSTYAPRQRSAGCVRLCVQIAVQPAQKAGLPRASCTFRGLVLRSEFEGLRFTAGVRLYKRIRDRQARCAPRRSPRHTHATGSVLSGGRAGRPGRKSGMVPSLVASRGPAPGKGHGPGHGGHQGGPVSKPSPSPPDRGRNDENLCHQPAVPAGHSPRLPRRARAGLCRVRPMRPRMMPLPMMTCPHECRIPRTAVRPSLRRYPGSMSINAGEPLLFTSRTGQLSRHADRTILSSA